MENQWPPASTISRLRSMQSSGFIRQALTEKLQATGEEEVAGLIS